MEKLRQNSLADVPFFQFFINLMQKNLYKNNHNKAKEEAANIINFCNKIKKIVGNFPHANWKYFYRLMVL